MKKIHENSNFRCIKVENKHHDRAKYPRTRVNNKVIKEIRFGNHSLWRVEWKYFQYFVASGFLRTKSKNCKSVWQIIRLWTDDLQSHGCPNGFFDFSEQFVRAIRTFKNGLNMMSGEIRMFPVEDKTLGLRPFLRIFAVRWFKIPITEF